MKKVLSLSLILVLCVVILTGCNYDGKITQENAPEPKPTSTSTPTSNSDPTIEEDLAYPMQFTDDRGNVTTFEKEPERVISLSPNITEVIYALGQGEKLVGRTAFCDYPQDVQSAVVVGDFIEWNFETILSLEPDVVFASSLNTEENEKKLKDLGINIVYLTQTESFDSAYEIIGMTGRVLNAEEESKQIIEDMKQRVAAVVDAVKGADRPSVYYVVGYGEYGDYTATGETFVASLLDMAGGDNIAADITGWVYSLEKLMEEDPYFILCSEEAKTAFQQTNGYKELTAVKEGRIYAIDDNIIVRQGPRLAMGLEAIAKILHPECFD